MRGRITVILLCLLVFVVFVRSNLHAQTFSGFSKTSPGWNQTLWKADYSSTWTFTWKPYAGTAAFDRYTIKIFNNGGLLYKIDVPGGKNATSMVIDFNAYPGVAKSNSNYYSWTLGAYNGTSDTPVALADSMPSSSGTTSSFRLPLYTADDKVWNIVPYILCPGNKVLTQKVRTFWAAWQQFQDHPQSFTWSNGNYSNGVNSLTPIPTVRISNRVANDTLYFGVESSTLVEKKLYYSGTVMEYLELQPTGADMPPASSMDGTHIYQTRAFNPYTNMATWKRDFSSGTYPIAFAIPAPYDQQWCTDPCTDTDGGHTYTSAGKISGGYAPGTCPGGSCTDSCSGTSVNEWYCDGLLQPKQEVLDCPSGSCSGGACAPGICIPALTNPQNGIKLVNTTPNIAWNQCTGAKYSQINITGTGVNSTITTGANVRSYTLSGLGFVTNNTYTWKVRACTDTTCTTAGNWSAAQSFKYYVCTKTNGDADCENGTDDNDYAIWKCEYLGNGTCTSPPSVRSADFNNDNKVDLADFEIWRANRYP